MNNGQKNLRMAGTTMARINGLELACMKNG